MKKLNNQQIELFTKCEQSIPKILNLADHCRQAQLFILWRELEFMGKQMKDSLDLQARAFRDDALYEDLPLFPYGKV